MDASTTLSDDLSDYDVISNPSHRSLESSLADLQQLTNIREPPPTQAAKEKFETTGWTPDDVKIFVQRALNGSPLQSDSKVSPNRTVKVYVDGRYDGFNAGHALQLRQAKLAFPSVHLMVGVFSDEIIRYHGFNLSTPHVERCEVVRHCRWVDEVITEAPWQVDDEFFCQHRIDYIAVDEGATVDPGYNKERLRGYDDMKQRGKVIPTRKTSGLVAPNLSPASIVVPTTPTKESTEASPIAPDFIDDTYGLGY